MLREKVLTHIHPTQAAAALRRVKSDYTDGAVAILLAQLLFETANFDLCYNYNIGNAKVKIVKGVAQAPYCMYSCSEIIKGKLVKFSPPDQQTWFLSFDSLDQAIDHYLSILERRWPEALKSAVACDIAGFCANLKKGGSRKNLQYYTDTESHYRQGIESRMIVANAVLNGSYRATIKFGDKGDNVIAWQHILKQKCPHEISCDGVFGRRTEALTKYLQAANGLTADGIVGPVTWSYFHG